LGRPDTSLARQCRINLAQDLGCCGVRGSLAWEDALTIYELAERDCEMSLKVGSAAELGGPLPVRWPG
jgi:hypothetical protein